MSFQVVTCLQPFFSVQSNFFQPLGVDPVSTWFESPQCLNGSADISKQQHMGVGEMGRSWSKGTNFQLSDT